MSNYTSETLDKMYLEYSNLTEAKTRKEIELESKVAKAKKLFEKVINDDTPYDEIESFLYNE